MTETTQAPAAKPVEFDAKTMFSIRARMVRTGPVWAAPDEYLADQRWVSLYEHEWRYLCALAARVSVLERERDEARETADYWRDKWRERRDRCQKREAGLAALRGDGHHKDARRQADVVVGGQWTTEDV